MPDPTDFVTNLPADFEIFGDAVDLTVDGIETTANAALPETIIDAAGDLIYGSAADTAARLAIGTAGQVLQVNSGATAPEWASPAAGGKNFTLLSTTTLTGSQVNITGITGDHIVISWHNVTSTDTNTSLGISLNQGAAGSANTRFGFSRTLSSLETFAANTGEATTASTETIGGLQGTTNNLGFLTLEGASGTGGKIGFVQAFFRRSVDATQNKTHSSILFSTDPNPITSVRFQISAGTFGGTVRIWSA
jgi:hypothetical protein